MNDALCTLHQELRACRKCLEAGYQISPPPIFSGNQDSKVMLIGQAPGYTEMENHRPFNYTSGTRLFKWLAAAGWDEADFRARHYMASMTRCYPGRHASGRGDRVPTKEEQTLCAVWRKRELEILDLKVIIPVGKLAIGMYFDTKLPLTAIIGQTIERDGVTIVPLPHPSGASNWHMLPQNIPSLEAAIAHLKHLREKYGL